MENKKLYWVVVDKDYIDYLKTFDDRIPDYDYGEYAFKPFYGMLIENDDLCYVSQINHYKSEKHDHLPSSKIDFQKIYDTEYELTIGTTNLNYMFPVPKGKLHRLNYMDIDKERKYHAFKDKVMHINLLKKMLHGLNYSNLSKRASIVRQLRYMKPDSALAKRCLDFEMLEHAAHEYDQTLDQNINDIAEIHEPSLQEVKI